MGLNQKSLLETIAAYLMPAFAPTKFEFGTWPEVELSYLSDKG